MDELITMMPELCGGEEEHATRKRDATGGVQGTWQYSQAWVPFFIITKPCHK